MSTLPDSLHDSVAVIRANHPLDRAISACLAGLSANTQKAYHGHIARFQASGRALDREGVSLWLDTEAARGLGAAGLNIALAALKRLADEAARLAWLDWDTAQRIGSIKSRKHQGIRTGKWLTLAQVKALLASPDRSTLAGARDACVLALLTGCGLRRNEACKLEVGQLVKQVDGEGLLLANVQGKGGRVRTVSVPGWAARDISNWITIAGIDSGRILRSMK